MKRIITLLITGLVYFPSAFAQWQWTQLGQTTYGNPKDNFGYSSALSADGNRFVIGAHQWGTDPSESGYLQVYQWNGSQWMQMGNDMNANFGVPYEAFGWSVSISADGNRVAGGSYKASGERGYVQVYEWSGNDWVKLGGKISGEDAEDRSGWSIALSGDGNRLAIGSPWNDDSGTRTGQVRVYQFNGSNWVQMGNDIYGTNSSEYQLGLSVSLSFNGERLVAGGVSSNSIASGEVRVYKWSNNNWDTEFGEWEPRNFGLSVSISADGNKVAVGAPTAGNGTIKPGVVKIYQLISDSGWVKMGDNIWGEAEDDRFGWSVSLSADGNTVAIGAPEGNESGYVWVFKWNGSAWEKFGNDIEQQFQFPWSGTSFYNLGKEVSLSSDGNRVLIAEDYNSSRDGAIHVYEYKLSSGINDNPDNQNFIASISTDGERLYMNSAVQGIITLDLYNLIGQCLFTQKRHIQSQIQEVFTLEEIPQGIYLAKISHEAKVQIAKIVRR